MSIMKHETDTISLSPEAGTRVAIQLRRRQRNGQEIKHQKNQQER